MSNILALPETLQAAEIRHERAMQFEKFGFTRRSHTADKVGEYANQWKGEVVLTTEAPNIDELEAARYFEAMVIAGALPLHGSGWRMAYINFNFNPSPADKESLGNISLIVHVGYKSSVKPLKEEEIIERFQLMGIPLELKA